MSDTQKIEARVETLEEQVETLVERNQQLKQQQEKVTGLFQQFKTGAISRRAFVTSVSALAGIGYAAGSASAAPSWGSATGNVGEEAQPLSYGYIQDFTAETVSTGDIDTGREWKDVTSNRSIGSSETNSTQSEIIVAATISITADGTTVETRLRDYDAPEGVTAIDRLDRVLDTGDSISLYGRISPGHTYDIINFGDASTSLEIWTEFRP